MDLRYTLRTGDLLAGPGTNSHGQDDLGDCILVDPIPGQKRLYKDALLCLQIVVAGCNCLLNSSSFWLCKSIFYRRPSWPLQALFHALPLPHRPSSTQALFHPSPLLHRPFSIQPLFYPGHLQTTRPVAHCPAPALYITSLSQLAGMLVVVVVVAVAQFVDL